MIDLQPHELKIVREILQQFVPDHEVRAFGSRVTNTAKLYSDLDVVIVGEKKLDLLTLIEIKDAFMESDLPFRVDLLDWARISDQFRAVIGKEYQVLQTRAESPQG